MAQGWRLLLWLLPYMVLLLLLYGAYRLLKKFGLLPNGTAPDRDYLEGEEPPTKDWESNTLPMYLIKFQAVMEETYWMMDASPRCAMYGRLVNELTNNQLIMFANAYKKKYDRTVREAIAGTTLSGCSDTYNYEGQLLSRLDTNTIP